MESQALQSISVLKFKMSIYSHSSILHRSVKPGHSCVAGRGAHIQVPVFMDFVPQC